MNEKEILKYSTIHQESYTTKYLEQRNVELNSFGVPIESVRSALYLIFNLASWTIHSFGLTFQVELLLYFIDNLINEIFLNHIYILNG